MCHLLFTHDRIIFITTILNECQALVVDSFGLEVGSIQSINQEKSKGLSSEAKKKGMELNQSCHWRRREWNLHLESMHLARSEMESYLQILQAHDFKINYIYKLMYTSIILLHIAPLTKDCLYL